MHIFSILVTAVILATGLPALAAPIRAVSSTSNDAVATQAGFEVANFQAGPNALLLDKRGNNPKDGPDVPQLTGAEVRALALERDAAFAADRQQIISDKIHRASGLNRSDVTALRAGPPIMSTDDFIAQAKKMFPKLTSSNKQGVLATAINSQMIKANDDLKDLPPAEIEQLAKEALAGFVPA